MPGPNHFHNERNMCFFSFFHIFFVYSVVQQKLAILYPFFCLRHLAKGGVKAVFVNGTTGEGVQVRQIKTAPRSRYESSTKFSTLHFQQSLSLSERKELLEAWVLQKDHCPTIMAQVHFNEKSLHLVLCP